MKLAFSSLAAIAAVIVAGAPASAATVVVTTTPSPVTTLPTTLVMTPPSQSVVAGPDQIYYQFSTAITANLAGTFQSITPAFQFGATLPTTLGAITLYTGQTCSTTCSGGVLIPLDASSTPTGSGGTSVAFSGLFLTANSYTIAVSGTAPTGGADVNAILKFSNAPEPATWGMMVLGFGAIGAALRGSRRKVVFA